MADPKPLEARPKKRPIGPFRRAVLHGLAIVLPPLLTLAIFLWAGNTVATYLLEPVERIALWGLMSTAEVSGNILPASQLSEEQVEIVDQQRGIAEIDGGLYRLTSDQYYIPKYVYDQVRDTSTRATAPTEAHDIYTRYYKHTYLQRRVMVPLFLAVLVLVLYLVGKFLAAGVGRFLWAQIEKIFVRIPVVRNVYSSVKQVTDLMFSEPEIKATRVVAIEYPRKGIWTLALVTSDSMLDISAAANEPVLAVLVPTSPMPFTGFTMTVRKSETIDLDITIDQAIQFIVSCGVVVPPHQVYGRSAERDAVVSDGDAAGPPRLVLPGDGGPA